MNTLLAALLPWLQAFAAAVVPVLGTLALAWLRRRNINTTVIEAVGRAAGEAYRHVAASGRPITDPGALGAAIDAGGRYLVDRIPDTLQRAGVTPEAAAQLVGAELGRLLALDPSVRVGGAA